MKKLIASFFFFSIPLLASYEARDFTPLIGKTPGLDGKLLELHLTLYKGYVAAISSLEKSIIQMEKEGIEDIITYGALKRRIGWEYDGMRLHELYFENLGSSSRSSAAPLYSEIAKQFGSFEAWEAEYKKTGLIRGIGWVILYQGAEDKKLHIAWINEHADGHLVSGKPILVMDVWEHAYLTQFGLDRKGYIEAFWKNINWNIVEKRFGDKL